MKPFVLFSQLNTTPNRLPKRGRYGWYWSLAVALLALVPSTASAQSDDFDASGLEKQINQVIARTVPATVFIHSDLSPGGATGVIISADGLIATAGHCVEQPGSRFTVRLPDGREFPATGLGLERTLDCGMMQIDLDAIGEDKLPFVELGWSAELQVNQPCISLGHSGSFNRSRGLAVRFGRIASIASTDNGMIQSTCLMEPGDSGGPLFDINGRLIGIHSMINRKLSDNFEVPVDWFRIYWEQLQEKKSFRATEVESPFGLKLLRSRNHQMSFMGNRSTSSRGIKITATESDGWAESQGLLKDDRLLAIDDQRVGNSNQAAALLYRSLLLRRNDVTIELRREKKRKKVQVDFSKIAEDQERPMACYQCVKEKLVQPVPELADLEAQFVDLESKLDDRCALIESTIDKKENSSFGTAIWFKDRSYVVAKSSRVGKEPTVKIADRDSVPGQVVSRSKEHDLVLLRVDVPRSLAVSFANQDAINNQPLRLLLSPNPKNDGEISLQGSGEFSAKGSGFLGVVPSMEEAGKVTLREIVPQSAAEKADLRVNDEIVEINGNSIDSPIDLINSLSKFNAGDRIAILVNRDGETLVQSATLGARPEQDDAMEGMHIADSFAGGKSKVRSGFPKVVVHDGHVLPRECGGPVFDIAGNFIGINIARHSRTQCYFIPSHVVRDFVQSSVSQ